MSKFELQFAKAWSELPVACPVVLPWETSCWKQIVGRKSLVETKSTSFKRPLPPPVFHVSSPVEQLEPSKRQKPQSGNATSWQQIVKSSIEESWTEMRDAQFQTALRRWLDVIMQLPDTCLVVVQLKQLKDVSSQLRMMRDLFVKKAPQTLLKRCHSFLRFVQYLKDAGETFPGTENGLYAFLCNLRESGAPTSNMQSIMQSLNFAQHVIGLPELMPLTLSKRCLGSVGKRNEGPKRQASPFKLVEILSLHEVLHDSSEGLWTRVFVGTVLMAIYSRSRWTDMQHAEHLELDVDMFGDVAFAELKITNHKCQESTAFRNIFLCAVAPGLGVSEQPWIAEWVNVRNLLGINFSAGHPTLPAPDSEGSPTRRPLGTDEMKRWVSLVLESKGHSLVDRRLTSHSCKCTVLSWLAKHGNEWTDRMALGGHVSFMKSTVIYSRDAMARPLRVLEALLSEIRMKHFLPDETRSGRFRRTSQHEFGDLRNSELDPSGEINPHEWTVVRPSLSDGSHPTTSCRPTMEQLAPVTACADVVEIASSDDGEIKCEQSDTSDGSDALTTSSSEDEAGASYTGAARPMRLPTVPDSLKLVQHVKYKTLHWMEAQNFRIMLCGRTAIEGRYETATAARLDTPCCHTCWRHKSEYEC